MEYHSFLILTALGPYWYCSFLFISHIAWVGISKYTNNMQNQQALMLSRATGHWLPLLIYQVLNNMKICQLWQVFIFSSHRHGGSAETIINSICPGLTKPNKTAPWYLVVYFMQFWFMALAWVPITFIHYVNLFTRMFWKIISIHSFDI